MHVYCDRSIQRVRKNVRYTQVGEQVYNNEYITYQLLGHHAVQLEWRHGIVLRLNPNLEPTSAWHCFFSSLLSLFPLVLSISLRLQNTEIWWWTANYPSIPSVGPWLPWYTDNIHRLPNILQFCLLDSGSHNTRITFIDYLISFSSVYWSVTPIIHG